MRYFCFVFLIKKNLKKEKLKGSLKIGTIEDLIKYKVKAYFDTGSFCIFRADFIKKFINNNNIKYLHIHDLQIASSVFKANLKSLPVTLDLHENRPEIMKFYKHVNSFFGKLFISPSKWKVAEEKYCKMANSIVVVTDLAKKELISRTNINKEKIVVFSNTVSKSFYIDYKLDNAIIKRYSDSFVLLYLGNTSKRRGLKTVLNSIPELIKSIPNFKFVIVGCSSYDNELKRIVENYKISKYVDFEGWKSEDLFPSYIKAAKLGVSPLHKNIHHDTTYANKIFQYMSLGCPILCSDVKAQVLLLDTYKVGLVFEAENSSDLIKKLNTFKLTG